MVVQGETVTTTTAMSKIQLDGVKASPELSKILEELLISVPTKSELDTQICLNDSSNDDYDVVDRALQPLSLEEATNFLIEYKSVSSRFDSNNCDGEKCIPIKVLRSMQTLLNGSSEYLEMLGNLSELVYTRFPSSNSVDHDSQLSVQQIKFRQRMDRLRLKNEESKYVKLTGNLGVKEELDDINMKSMTYAASIGLNMIVAPLAFGAFMYFFAGALLDYFWKREDKRAMNNNTDIRKVIAGVVSGVIMLFIEMILFVIRTHEIDRIISKKHKKSSRPKPFGPYSSKTKRNFEKTDEL